MIFAYIESQNGTIKKSSLEVLTYGKKLADKMNTTLSAICLTEISDTSVVGAYGASTLFSAHHEALAHFDSKLYTRIIADVLKEQGGKIMVLPFNQNGKAIGPRLAVRMDAGFVPGTNSLPSDQMHFSKNVFSGKATASFKINTEVKIISVAANSLPLEKNSVNCDVKTINVSISESDRSVKFIKNELVSGDIPLSEADLVVSGGRGLKGPENWGMIEECAKILGAATACSRAVADVHWRPHHEHVGQTGLAISPNLYIAVGISGAIQHLAGVNSSKTIVVVNTDAEAPFFKAADYGVIGDAFEVMPKFNEALKKFKQHG
jgi:electron transfer flavoprotein alpha subunit